MIKDATHAAISSGCRGSPRSMPAMAAARVSASNDLEEIRLRHRRRDGVDSDGPLRELSGEMLGQVVEGGLAGPVVWWIEYVVEV